MLDEHCKTAYGHFASLIRSTAESNSGSVDIPDESNIGFRVASMYSMRHSLFTSPDAIFHAGIPMLLNKSTAALEKAELRKINPRFSA